MEVIREARIASRITVVEKRLTNGNSGQLLNGSTPLVKFTRYSISATVDQMSYVLRAPILKWKPKAPVIVGSRIKMRIAFATEIMPVFGAHHCHGARCLKPSSALDSKMRKRMTSSRCSKFWFKISSNLPSLSSNSRYSSISRLGILFRP